MWARRGFCAGVMLAASVILGSCGNGGQVAPPASPDQSPAASVSAASRAPGPESPVATGAPSTPPSTPPTTPPESAAPTASPVVASPVASAVAAPPSLPPGFTGADGAADLAVTETGGTARVTTGTATAVVHVPAGAAPTGATWHVVPLSAAPAGVENALAPGLWVDTAGAPPTAACEITFAVPGTASVDATIVRIADDGSGVTVVPTGTLDLDGQTLLTAWVDGFSGYTVATANAAARTKAQANAKKKPTDQGQGSAGAKAIVVDADFEDAGLNGVLFVYHLDLAATAPKGSWVFRGLATLSLEARTTNALLAPVALTVNGHVSDKLLTFEFASPETLAAAGAADPLATLVPPSADEQLASYDGTTSALLIGPGTGDFKTRAIQGSASNTCMFEYQVRIVGHAATVTIVIPKQPLLVFKGTVTVTP